MADHPYFRILFPGVRGYCPIIQGAARVDARSGQATRADVKAIKKLKARYFRPHGKQELRSLERSSF
jgi:hypothetical protein